MVGVDDQFKLGRLNSNAAIAALIAPWVTPWPCSRKLCNWKGLVAHAKLDIVALRCRHDRKSGSGGALSLPLVAKSPVSVSLVGERYAHFWQKFTRDFPSNRLDLVSCLRFGASWGHF